METHFYLNSDKRGTNPKKTIYCYVREGQNRPIILNTKEKIDPSHWNKETKRAFTTGRGKYIGAKELNLYLDSFENEVKKVIREMRADNVSVDFEDIRKALLEKYTSRFNSLPQKELFTALDSFIKIRSSELSQNSIKKFSNLKRLLSEYEGELRKKLTFRSLDLLFFDSFLFYLIKQKKFNSNTAYKNIGLLKTFLIWSYERGLNKYDSFRKVKKKEYAVDIVSLSEDELERIEKLDLSVDLKLDRVRDLFLFGCYTGARFSDITNILRADIKGDIWYLRQIKTKNTVEIPLISQAKEILKKYEMFEFPLPRISNQKFNIYLKELMGEKAKIDTPIRLSQQRGNETITIEGKKADFITTHTARRTFITLSLIKGINPQIVMSITGHKNFKSFQKYVNLITADKKKALSEKWEKKGLKLVSLTNSS